MLELNRHMVSRQETAGAFRPLDQDQSFSREDVVPAEIRQLVGTTQTIQIDVIDDRAGTGEFVNEGERRASYLVRHSIPSTDCPRECRLAGSELAAERDDERRAGGAAESLAPGDQLGFAEREMPSRGEWR